MTRELSVPGTTLGVVGGGQLGRMLAEAASPLGVEVVVLDPTPNCPAVPPASDQVVGDFADEAAVRALAERSDALTLEIELADPDLLERVAAETGVPVHPDPESLRMTRDKLVEKRRLEAAGVPVPAFRPADDADDLRAALDDLGCPAMVKARRGGYDGRGNVPVESPEGAAEAIRQTGPAVVEEFVAFARELSVIGVRGDGETAVFPVAENVHEAEILRESVLPARTSESVRERALAVAREVLEAMSGRGVFGIELFETRESRRAPGEASGRRPRDGGGEILVNEIAPRPHNSGHYTIEGAVTSQFEQHVRAVLGLPLGSTALRGPTAMANVLGDTDRPRPVAGVGDGVTANADPGATPAALRGVETALATPGIALHWYGKREVRPLRKMGHVTAVGTAGVARSDAESQGALDESRGALDESRDEILDRVRAVRDELTFE